MASPQKENGYIPIANELAEAFMRVNLSAHEWRVLWCVLRHSYGWNRKTAQITSTEIARMTRIDVRLIPRASRSLCEKQVLTREGRAFMLQKDYERWGSSVRMSSRQMSSAERKNIIPVDESGSSIRMNEAGSETLPDKVLQPPKDRKDTSQTSLIRREQLIKRLKTYLPAAQLPASVPEVKIDYFLWRIGQGFDWRHIRDPGSYIRALAVDAEFPPFEEREAAQELEKKRALERTRQQREEYEHQSEEKRAELRELARQAVKSLNEL